MINPEAPLSGGIARGIAKQLVAAQEAADKRETDAAPVIPPVEVTKFMQDQIESKARMGQHRVGRTIAGADVISPLPPERKIAGFQHRAIKDSGYIAVRGEPFVRRATPKVKGKAAVKAAKKARHAARNRIGNA
jgi:hypothetical protein